MPTDAELEDMAIDERNELIAEWNAEAAFDEHEREVLRSSVSFRW